MKFLSFLRFFKIDFSYTISSKLILLHCYYHHHCDREQPFISVAKHRLAFFHKEGFDRFGRNKLFAPLMKWEAFKHQVVKIRDNARDYETAYNGIKASIERQDGIKQILQALPQSAVVQVSTEKERLVEARRVAVSEKGAYVPVNCYCL